MFTWLLSNWINILLLALIALACALVIRSMVRDRRAGKSACGGNCSGCGGGSCCGCDSQVVEVFPRQKGGFHG